jgi:hypothetical protein
MVDLRECQARVHSNGLAICEEEAERAFGGGLVLGKGTHRVSLRSGK